MIRTRRHAEAIVKAFEAERQHGLRPSREWVNVAIPVAKEWLRLIDSQSPTRQDVDALLEALEVKPSDCGAGWIDLELGVKSWARTLNR